MEYYSTTQEKKKWLLAARRAKSSFGKAEFKIETTGVDRVHIVDARIKATHCGDGEYAKKTLTTFIDAWLKTYGQETYCYLCFENAYDLPAYPNSLLNDLEDMLFNIAAICIYAKKIKTKPPVKYDSGWEQAVECLNDTRYYKYVKEPELQGILQNELLEAEKILEEYFVINKGQVSDALFMDTMVEEGRLLEAPRELLVLDNLNIKMKKELTEKERNKIREFTKSLGMPQLVGKIPEKTTLDQNNYNSFKDWVLAETVENELQLIEKMQAAHFEKAQTLRSSIEKSSMSLVKIAYDKGQYYTAGTICDYLTSLEKVSKTINNIGMLIPTKLISLLKTANNWPYGLVSLGVVKKTDTPEVFETALSLDLAPAKALKAARLLHKEK